MAADDSENEISEDSTSGKPDRKLAGKRYKLPSEERLTRSAIHYLDRYASSLENLRKVLNRRVNRATQANGRSPDEFAVLVDKVVEKCQRAGMVDDRSYAETKLAGLRRRGRSKRRIMATLSAKGVAKDVIAAVIDQDDTSDLDAARTYARRRKLGPWRPQAVRKDFRDKDMAALCRAGYSFEIARKVIDAADDGEAASAAM